ncbi:hypothetical protein, partial [Halopseudomonas aestusnigri]|uniref:hypothetical protein n=1 Tax=Halopseudomonas aestusnigri TaxID=857252 RepID=UPI003001805D
ASQKNETPRKCGVRQQSDPPTGGFFYVSAPAFNRRCHGLFASLLQYIMYSINCVTKYCSENAAFCIDNVINKR